LPLAREGFAVDALEPAPALCKILKESVAAEGLSVGVVEGNILDASVTLPRSSYRLLLLSEVVASHFRHRRAAKAAVRSRRSPARAGRRALVQRVFE